MRLLRALYSQEWLKARQNNVMNQSAAYPGTHASTLIMSYVRLSSFESGVCKLTITVLIWSTLKYIVYIHAEILRQASRITRTGIQVITEVHIRNKLMLDAKIFGFTLG